MKNLTLLTNSPNSCKMSLFPKKSGVSL